MRFSSDDFKTTENKRMEKPNIFYEQTTQEV
jgi:hypothetical protein